MVRQRRNAWKTSAWKAGLVLGVLGSGAVAAAADTPAPPLTRPASTVTATPPTTPLQKSLLTQMQDAFTQIARTVEPTVVNIKSVRSATAPALGDGSSDGLGLPPSAGRGKGKLPLPPHRLEATGSGVIVRPDGYILTNDHVVDGAIGGMVTVTMFDGREFQGKVYPDFKSDLAIVKIDPGKTPLPVAQFGGSAPVVAGQWALAVGSPFDLQNTVTVGVISAVNRHQQINGEGTSRYYPDLIQTDAAINPGNSGGPLFDIDGKVVGINVAIESPVEGSAGVGFAIPVAIAQQVASELITQGKVVRGYLGLTPEDLTPALEAQYGRTDGAFVRDVLISSPAGKAGIQASDIVTAYNSKLIHSELDLRQAIASSRPGEKVAIRYVRSGQADVALATISPPPALAGDAPAGQSPLAPPRLHLGVIVRSLTTHDKLTMNLPAATTGVVVVSVAAGSAGEMSGIMPGMVIQRVNQTAVSTKVSFEAAMTYLPQAAVTLVILNTDPADNQVYQRAVTVGL